MLLAEVELNSGAASLVLDYLHAEQIQVPAISAALTTYSRSGRMTHAQLWDTLAALQQAMPERHVGLEIGRHIKPSHMGVVGYLLLTSSSLAEVVQRFQRFTALLHQSDTVIVDFHEDTLRVRWTTHYEFPPQISDEIYFSGILHFLRLCTGNAQLTYSQLQFTFAEPADSAAHARHFGCPLLFGQSYSEFRLPPAVLMMPVNHADPALNSLLEQQAIALLAALPQPGSFTQVLRDVLLRCLQNGNVAAAAVAAELAMSRRTLHRRLSEQGLDFSTALQRVREQLARQYLADTSLSLSEIALLLGYQEQSSFTRSFKLWSGETPLKFRQQLLASKS